MVPDTVVDVTIDALQPLLTPGDVVIDGGNSHYKLDPLRAALRAPVSLNTWMWAPAVESGELSAATA